jgi:hypothetical protein
VKELSLGSSVDVLTCFNTAAAGKSAQLETDMETEGYKPGATTPPASPASPSSASFTRFRFAHLRYRCIVIFLAIVAYVLYQNTFAMATTSDSSNYTDLSIYTDAIFIPYIFKFSTEHTPQIKTTIEGVDIEMPIDTGSTGLLIGAPLVSNISTSVGTPAHHFFTSSKILYVGRLVEMPMTFHGENGSTCIARAPILVVDKSWMCPWYDTRKDGFACPRGPEGEEAAERDTSQITYMGVGFGRNEPKDGMPYGVPRANPFLNVESINGRRVTSASLRSGYTISAQGVALGLTADSTRGFAFTKLGPGLTHSEDARDWAMVRMCFSINGEGRYCGPGLVDTGIPQMYVRAEEGVSIPSVTIPNPNPHGIAKTVKRVKRGTTIGVGFPSLDKAATRYSFAVGEEAPMEPSYVVPAKAASPPFVNTGRNFLFGYSVAFDAIGGRFGFRPASGGASFPPCLL